MTVILLVATVIRDGRVELGPPLDRFTRRAAPPTVRVDLRGTAGRPRAPRTSSPEPHA